MSRTMIGPTITIVRERTTPALALRFSAELYCLSPSCSAGRASPSGHRAIPTVTDRAAVVSGSRALNVVLLPS
jgi:hypothetical protein